MKTNATVVLNVTLKDSPAKVAGHLEKLKELGIVASSSRGAAQGSGESDIRTERGEWEKAWCKFKDVSHVRRTGGRNFEQQAHYNFATYAPEAMPNGLRAPRS